MNTPFPMSAKAHSIARKLQKQEDDILAIQREEDEIKAQLKEVRGRLKKRRDRKNQLIKEARLQHKKDKVASQYVTFSGVWGKLLEEGFTPQEVAAIQLQAQRKQDDDFISWSSMVIGVSTRRFRQIVDKANRKLRSPRNAQNSLDRGLVEMDEKVKEALAIREEHKKTERRMRAWKANGFAGLFLATDNA